MSKITNNGLTRSRPGCFNIVKSIIPRVVPRQLYSIVLTRVLATEPCTFLVSPVSARSMGLVVSSCAVFVRCSIVVGCDNV